MRTTKSPVTLRGRKLKDGSVSLYLDICTEGRRYYEYLKLYLKPDRGNPTAKAENENTRNLAASIAAARTQELFAGRHGLPDANKGRVLFLEYFKACAHGKNKNLWSSTFKHLCSMVNKSTTFSDIDVKWCRRLVDKFNALPLAASTKSLYLSKVTACFNRAVQEEVIQRNPLRGLVGSIEAVSPRQYLTLDEVRAMAAVQLPKRWGVFRRAFLFSCLTGLRVSDIRALRWSQVRHEDGYTRLVYRQQKTQMLEYLDISPEAVRYMGEPSRKDAPVFGGLPSTSHYSYILKRWCSLAGIAKHITFHSARHSFAVAMLELGTDIYTVSKLLGHRELSTTQVYAHLLDKTKREAVMRLPSLE